MRIEKLTKEKEKDWNSFVATSPKATFFHKLEWREIIKKNYNLQDQYLICLKNNNEQIQGILPLFKTRDLLTTVSISLPFCDYGGILAENEQAFETFKNYLEKTSPSRQGFAEAGQKIELRQKEKIDIFNIPANQKNVTSIIELNKNADNIWGKINKKARNQTKKSLKFGFTFNHGHKYLNDFYRLYALSMKNHGTPVHSKTFYKNTLEAFEENADIFVAKDQEKIIAAMLIFKFKNTICNNKTACDPSYKKYSINNFLYWQAINWSCENGFAYFDMGRSQSGSPVLHFKEQWSPITTPLYYYKINHSISPSQIKNSRGRLDSIAKIWRLLPLPITKFFGPYLRKFLP